MLIINLTNHFARKLQTAETIGKQLFLPFIRFLDLTTIIIVELSRALDSTVHCIRLLRRDQK